MLCLLNILINFAGLQTPKGIHHCPESPQINSKKLLEGHCEQTCSVLPLSCCPVWWKIKSLYIVPYRPIHTEACVVFAQVMCQAHSSSKEYIACAVYWPEEGGMAYAWGV